MRSRDVGIRRWAGTVAVLAVLLTGPAWAVEGPETASPESAVWASKQLRFVFMGFTAHYSCDGLADKMRQVLLQLGARPQDLKVDPVPCSSPFGRPDPFPGVTVKMNVLEPAKDNAGAGGSTAIVPAHWKTVSIDLSRDPVWAAGQCELVEQIKDNVLPKFTTRNVHYSSNCIPHQLEVGGTTLRADVLVADTAGMAAAAATPPAMAPGAASPAAATASAASVFVYPRNGQSAAQTQSDRDECHSWAVSQSGYDPTRSTQPPSANAADYRRAVIACLDARGYTAR
jgi:hypothetical protein